MKKLIIVAAALFAMSAFAADPTTTTAPADAGMAKDAAPMAKEGAMTQEKTTTTTKKEHKKAMHGKMDHKKMDKAAPAADAPASGGETK